MNQELQDYIKKSKEAGFNDEQIKQELLKVGWQEQDINQALTDNTVPAPMPNPEIAGPKSKSKLFRVIVIVVIAIVLIGGGVLGYKYLFKPPGIKNYGHNLNDFIEVAKSCSPSKVKWVGSGTLGLDTETVQHEIELKGLDSNQNCILVDKNTVTELKMSEMMKQLAKQIDPATADAQIKQYEADALIDAKKGGDVTITCYFNVNYIVQALNNLSKNIIFLTSDFISGNCIAIDTNGKQYNIWGIEHGQFSTDCGSIINTHIVVSPNQLTQQEKDSLKCINEAFVDCKLAKFEIVAEGEDTSGSYEIKGKEEQNCSIVQEILQPASSKTCKIPMSFIADSKIAAENQNQSDMLFVLTIPFVFTFETTTNTQTGEVINFECQ